MSNYIILFYPILKRRENYKTTRSGNYYADYHEYYNEIEEDCKKRCVYCDIHLDEIGGEGMQLDHFRPKSIPEFNHLENDPNNLVLSCPKCNFLKSNCWVTDVDCDATHIDDCGFIDPFKENRHEYFKIINTGNINAKKAPALYMIKLMQLNRIARQQVRRHRILKKEILLLVDVVNEKIEKLFLSFKKVDNSVNFKQKLNDLKETHGILKKLLNETLINN